MLKVGLQLYSIRNSMAKNPLEAIESVGKLGYKFVEFANHNATVDFGCGFGVEAKILKNKLDSYKMKAVSAHISPIDFENIDTIMTYYNELECKNLVCPAAFFDNKYSVLKKCEELNKIGEKLSQVGISYLYHNHFHEFQRFDGEYVLEIIKDNVDPNFVGFQLDTFWAMRGGADPVEIIKRLGKSIKLVHQKDYSKEIDIPTNIFSFIDPNMLLNFDSFVNMIKTPMNGFSQEEVIVEIGTGKMDIQAIIDATTAYTDAQYIILEQDYTKHDELESIEISMESFRKFKGISWE